MRGEMHTAGHLIAVPTPERAQRVQMLAMGMTQKPATFTAGMSVGEVDAFGRDHAAFVGAARARLLQLLEAAGFEDPWGRTQRRRLSALLFT